VVGEQAVHDDSQILVPGPHRWRCAARAAVVLDNPQVGFAMPYPHPAVALATPARMAQEIKASKAMLDRIEQRHGIKPERLAADKAYGTGPFLA
jgi:hypothetical protein